MNLKIQKKVPKRWKMSKIKHKKHPKARKTWCGIEYDRMMDIKNYDPEVFIKRIVGHWKKVTCKRCLKQKDAKR